MDELTNQLNKLKGNLPKPQNLTTAEKQKLISQIGPRTVKTLLKAKSELPMRRIPFLFSSLDTQAVIDVLHNDWSDPMLKWE